MKKLFLTLSASLLFSTPLAAVHADIYQFTDENGVVHFTNTAGGGKTKKMKRVREKTASSGKAQPGKAPSGNKSVRQNSSPDRFADLIREASSRHGVDPELVHAVVKVESNFNPYAVSRKGAMGLMQLMPGTALDLRVKNSFDPGDNIDGGVKYLRYLIDRYEGNISLALAAYNAGETAVKKWGAIPPYRETQDYVRKILKLYNKKETYQPLSPQYTIFMGYSDEGVLVLTDNPPSDSGKFKRRQQKASL